VCSACQAAGGLCTRCDERLTALPWLERGERGFMSALFATLKLMVVDPRRYGRAAAQARGVSDALLFGSLCAFVNCALLMLMVSPIMIIGIAAAQKQREGQDTMPPYVVPLMLLFAAIMGLVMFVIGSYFWALVLRVTTAVSSLRSTVTQLWTVVLYAAGPLVIAWIPLAGLLAPVYGSVLTILGVHEATESKSLLRSSLAVVVPLALFILVFGSAYLALIYFAISQAQPAV
jgi:hypothetical protein